MCSKYTVLNVTSKFNSNECFKFEFKVRKFSNVRSVTTSQLVTSHKCRTSWRVILETIPFLSGVRSFPRAISNEGKMRIGLVRTDSRKCDVKASFFFTILNSSGHVYFKESFEKMFSQKNFKFFCDFMKKPGKIAKVYGMRGVEFKLPDDILTVNGSILIQDCCPKLQNNNAEHTINQVDHNTNMEELHNNFFEMYENHYFSDVVLYFGNSKIYAHKSILSSRSQVFKKMFEQDMMENNLNIVQISDIEKDVFEAFLKFLYTGEVKYRDLDTILSLYSAADKYEVTTLFKTCSNIIETYISDRTVSSILKYADLHNDKDLKDKALTFICENFLMVGKTKEWSKFVDTDPRLASLILLSLSSKLATEEVKN